MATPSEIFTEMVTTTDHHWEKAIADNMSLNNALYRKLREKGKIKSFSGGLDAAVPLEYAENQTFQRYFGYDQLDMGASDVLTSASFPFQQAVITVTASGREIRQNMGSAERMIDLVKARKSNALRTSANRMSEEIYSDGTLPNQMNGLQSIIQTNGQGTVGGIDSSSWTFWRNKFREVSGTDPQLTPNLANSTTFRGDFNAMWLQLVRGTDKPDLIVLSHDFYALAEVMFQDQIRYTTARAAESGYQELKYKGADIIFDDNANFATTSQTGYFLNTDYLWIYQHSDAKWSPEPDRVPTNQDAVVIPFFWMGNMVCSNRCLQGRLIDAA